MREDARHHNDQARNRHQQGEHDHARSEVDREQHDALSAAGRPEGDRQDRTRGSHGENDPQQDRLHEKQRAGKAGQAAEAVARHILPTSGERGNRRPVIRH